MAEGRAPEDPVGPGGPRGPERPTGTLRTTSPAALTAFVVVGLVGGWFLHPVAEGIRGTAPVVTWAQPLTLIVIAVILGITAWSTWRSVHVRRERLDPHQAVNRLVLGRACALVGALVGAGYLGYALSWLGIDTDLATQRLLRSVVAGIAGVVIATMGLLLERACRIRSDDSGA